MISTAPVRLNRTKCCGSCGVRKRLASFPRHRHHSDGRGTHCKSCNAKKSRKWYRRQQKKTNRLYSVYVAMKQRCHCEKHDNYRNYGGRGIHVCDQWRRSFDVFYRWATANGYQPGLQLDRIDKDKGYAPDNCRFVTPLENARHKRKRTVCALSN